MMRMSRKRIGHPAWLGLALVVGLPALAEAQLFPNRTITRERQPCASEPPFYSTVRRNFYGYYPTCWSRFPDGWGCPCPNPELPNAAAAFEKRPRDPLVKPTPDEDFDYLGNDLAPPMDPGGADGMNLPPVPPQGGASPFPSELNPRDNLLDLPATPDPTIPPRGPGAGSRPVPGAGARPRPDAGGGLNGTFQPNTSSTDQPAGTTALLEMPPLSAPASTDLVNAPAPTPNAGSLTLAPEATLTSINASDRPNLGPLPAPVRIDPSVLAPPTYVADPTLLNPNLGSAVPAQAPQRRGVLSGLFNPAKRKR